MYTKRTRTSVHSSLHPSQRDVSFWQVASLSVARQKPNLFVKTYSISRTRCTYTSDRHQVAQISTGFVFNPRQKLLTRARPLVIGFELLCFSVQRRLCASGHFC